MCELGNWVLEDFGEEFSEEVLVFGGGSDAECAGGDSVIIGAAADGCRENFERWYICF